MNTNAKTLIVPETPRPFLDGVWFAIAFGLRWINREYDDYEIRLHMGELTEAEARAEIISDWENEEDNRLTGVFWSGG